MINTQQMATPQQAARRVGQMLGGGSLSNIMPSYEMVATNMAVAAEKKRTGMGEITARNEVMRQEQKQAPSVLARRRKQFLEGTILGSLMPEPSIELGAPMSMLGSSTLLGS